MFKSAKDKFQTVAMVGVIAALAIGGVAAAQDDSQGGSQGSQGSGHPAGPPPMGPPMKGLTYAEFHVQKNGQAQTIRLDQGKITAVDDSSITLSENDGSEVTVAVDEDTEVIGKPGEETTLDDLSVGQQVSVCGPEGGTAKSVMVAPAKGDLKGAPQGAPKGGQMPPPPGGSGPGGSE